MFQWNWNSVAAECTAFLGPAGYGFVQVSPAQESISGAQWSTSYSPVSYIIDNKLGTRDEYAAMVTACHDAGVLVIADAVLNHMSGSAFNEPGDAAGSSECPDNLIDLALITCSFHILRLPRRTLGCQQFPLLRRL